MSKSEISCKLSKISTHVEKKEKRVHDLKQYDDDSETTFDDDDEDTNILGVSKQKNEALGCQPQNSNRPNK